ncbi:MAG: hypothetical protein SGILL_005647 [Bacillariaceae sp.]
MKISTAAALLLLSAKACAFTTVVVPPSKTATSMMANTQLFMFGGAGAGAPAEDDEAAEEQLNKAAAAMGMSAQEYKLALQARTQLQNAMDEKIVKGGKEDSVLVERDVNQPPKKFDITITEAGKAKGGESVSKELVAALKTASGAAKQGRAEAQQEMMKWVQSQGPK